MQPRFRPRLLARAAWHVASHAIPLIGIYTMYFIVNLTGIEILEWVVLGIVAATTLWAWHRQSAWWTWGLFIITILTFRLAAARVDELGMPLQVEYVILMDRLLGFGELPTIRLQEAFYSPGEFGGSIPLLGFVYSTFFVLPYFVMVGLWRRDPVLAKRFTISFIVISVVATVTFAIVPTAPPWMAAEAGDVGPISRIVEEQFAALHPEFTRAAYEEVEINQVAAFPSLHMAVAVLSALGFAAAWPRLRWAATLYSMLMAYALVFFGEHYLVDTLAGAALALGTWKLIERPSILTNTWQRFNRTAALRNLGACFDQVRQPVDRSPSE